MTGLLGNIANPFDLPMSAGPNDTFVGMSEYGTPIMRTPTGQQYVVRPVERQAQPAPQPQPEPLLSYGDMRRAARSAPSAIRQGDTGALQGLLSAAVEGLTAPGRAARGENVTLGDVWATALDYGGVANLAPAPAGALRSGNVRNIRAYHGSPHDFDRFSMDAIGTGEGAQAYGHGLYFAEAEDVARQYRNNLATVPNTPEGNVWDLVNRYGQNPDDLKTIVEDMITYAPTEGQRQKAQEMLRVVNSGSWMGVKPLGAMYEVNIAANPDDFLDWDAPITESPVAFQDWVRARMDSADLPEGSRRQRQLQNWRGAPGDWQAPEGANVPPPRVAEARNWLANYGETQAEMTEALREAGIPGIKYRDAMSRNLDGSQGTRNFVVFDENLISIVRKYGIAGAAALLGMSVADVEGALAQQDQKGLLE